MDIQARVWCLGANVRNGLGCPIDPWIKRRMNSHSSDFLQEITSTPMLAKARSPGFPMGASVDSQAFRGKTSFFDRCYVPRIPILLARVTTRQGKSSAERLTIKQRRMFDGPDAASTTITAPRLWPKDTCPSRRDQKCPDLLSFRPR